MSRLGKSDTRPLAQTKSIRLLEEAVANIAYPVTSVNSQTGAVVLDSDDIDDAGKAHQFATTGQLAKVDHLTVTQAVDLDTMETKLATIAAGAEVNVNADWTSVAGDSQISNKPPLLLAVEALSATGLVTRLGSSSAAARTITAGAGISVSNGDAVAANPQITCTVTPGQPIPSGSVSTWAIGTMAVLLRQSGGALADGATAAGSTLRSPLIQNDATPLVNGGTPSGTWQNISGTSVTTAEACTFLRTA